MIKKLSTSMETCLLCPTATPLAHRGPCRQYGSNSQRIGGFSDFVAIPRRHQFDRHRVGLVVLYGFFISHAFGAWTALFLATTILTSVTGFFLPPFGFDRHEQSAFCRFYCSHSR
jgi:hypothetical protein